MHSNESNQNITALINAPLFSFQNVKKTFSTKKNVLNQGKIIENSVII